MRSLSSDPEGVVLEGERRRLMMANLVAMSFFRRELLREGTAWPVERLKARGAAAMLSAESNWSIGYAPESNSRLVDHLRSRGFDFRTAIRAGLARSSEAGHPIDNFQDQLILLARDSRMDPVGFVGVSRDEPPAYLGTPTTLIHRPSNALVGVAEQMDLLEGGAMVVVVDDPMDAMAVEQISRMSAGRWAGIPLCGSLMSSAQARTLGRYSGSDTVIVALNRDRTWNATAITSLKDLSYFYQRVRAVELPDGHTATSLLQAENGPQQLHDALLCTRPLRDYQSRRRQPAVRHDPSASSTGPTP